MVQTERGAGLCPVADRYRYGYQLSNGNGGACNRYARVFFGAYGDNRRAAYSYS